MNGEFIRVRDVEQPTEGIYVWTDVDDFGLGHEKHGSRHPRTHADEAESAVVNAGYTTGDLRALRKEIASIHAAAADDTKDE